MEKIRAILLGAFGGALILVPIEAYRRLAIYVVRRSWWPR